MLLAATFWEIALNVVFCITGIFLIFLVLIQRGKGGGLIGALGGGGGSSPFGSRAGDTFTRITLGVAAFWFALAMLQILQLQGCERRVEPPPPIIEAPPGS